MVRVKAEWEYDSLLPVEFALASTVVYVTTRTYSALLDVTFGLVSESEPTPQYDGALDVEFELVSGDIFDPAGPVYAGLSVDTGSGGTVAWADPGNAEGAPDGEFATVNLVLGGDVSNFMLVNDYSISFDPAGSVAGVTATIWLYALTTNQTVTVQLSYLGSPIGTAKTFSPASAGGEIQKSLGGTSDLWGASLTPAIVNDPSFGVTIQSDNTSAFPNGLEVDAIQIAVNG
jgi:hypothetical protein